MGTTTPLTVLRGRLRIIGPPVTTITHDGTNNNQAFGLQQWEIHSNAKKGASVNFQTTNAFRNTFGGVTIKRDAKIQLDIDRQEVAANWVVTSAVSQTNYAVGNEVAVVSAISAAPGDATFNVRVTFIETDFSALRAGTYSTTVVGTITANK